jgi:hypothetical protein
MHSILVALLASALISTGYATLMHLSLTVLLSVISVCLAGFLSHLVLDLLTTGNMPVLWPFSKRKFAFNLTHFIDPTFFGVLLVAAILLIYTETDANVSKIVAAAAIAFLTVNFGTRFYMKNTATKILKGLDDSVASEILSFPTLRPDRWLAVRKTQFENGYRYEIYRINSVHKKTLGKTTVESPYIGYSSPVELPIDSAQKAVARSKKDNRISNYIEKFVLPSVDVAASKDGDMWQVFWYDAFTYVKKGERQGILAIVRADGTINVDDHSAHDSTLKHLITQKQLTKRIKPIFMN